MKRVDGRIVNHSNPYQDKAQFPCLSYTNSQPGTRKILKINFRKDFARLGKYRRGFGGVIALRRALGHVGQIRRKLSNVCSLIVVRHTHDWLQAGCWGVKHRRGPAEWRTGCLSDLETLKGVQKVNRACFRLCGVKRVHCHNYKDLKISFLLIFI